MQEITPPLRLHPTKLFVESTARCNLECAMCVKQAQSEEERCEGDMTVATFEKLIPAMPNVEALILSGIGEPLMNQDLERFIEIAKTHMSTGGWVGFQSNGLLLDSARALKLARAGLDVICLSVDGTEPETISEIRKGIEAGSIKRAVESVGAARFDGHDLKLWVEFVVMRDNLAQLPGLVRWAASQGADKVLVTQMLPYNARMAAETGYDPNTDAAVNFFKPWKQKALSEQVDMGQYFNILWKYTKTPEDERVVDFVERMKEDAHSRDIFVNLQSILNRDEDWHIEVEEIFDEALSAAGDVGIEISLPEVLPKSERKCEFVESGGVFVSWKGEVHPCYFLWHGYRCYVNGREKHILPKVFGTVSETPLLEIWNSGEFADFRSNVIRYDYPFCSDCNLGKCCDYVQAEEFEQDCYLNNEPCGDCLWCKGVFQCLQ